MSKIEEKLVSLGITLPEAAKPVAAYIPGIAAGDLVFTSGQLPFSQGKLLTGKLGDTMDTKDGYEAAKICAINCLAVLKSLVGDLDLIEQVVKLTGFVNCTQDFTEQPAVINGASELLGQVFGNEGQHSRSAVGAASLPLGACCEVEIIVKVKKPVLNND